MFAKCLRKSAKNADVGGVWNGRFFADENKLLPWGESTTPGFGADVIFEQRLGGRYCSHWKLHYKKVHQLTLR